MSKLTDADRERLKQIKLASATGFYTDRNADRDIAVLLHIIETLADPKGGV